MLNLFRKKVTEPPQFPGFSWLYQDIHSHLLPGIDDGSPNVETSIELIRGLQAAGISRFICTPHIIGDMYRNNKESITSALNILKAEVERQGLDIELSAAAEYMLDDHFMSLLRREEPLLTLKDNLVLTELNYSTPVDNLEEIAFEIITANYAPLMAHPERYHYYHKTPAMFHRLKELGFSLQVNLLSLTGYYGRHVAKTARYLFDNDLVDFVGTDLHHANHLRALTAPSSVKMFEKYLGNREFNHF